MCDVIQTKCNGKSKKAWSTEEMVFAFVSFQHDIRTGIYELAHMWDSFAHAFNLHDRPLYNLWGNFMLEVYIRQALCMYCNIAAPSHYQCQRSETMCIEICAIRMTWSMQCACATSSVTDSALFFYINSL